jgi:hypothetical protein
MQEPVMPHQNTTSSKATAQNAATDPVETGDRPEGAPGGEPRSYAAPEVGDATLASPAAGEMADYVDEGEALGADDVQQGGNHSNRPYRTEKQSTQGAKTVQANQERLKGEG